MPNRIGIVLHLRDGSSHELEAGVYESDSLSLPPTGTRFTLNPGFSVHFHIAQSPERVYTATYQPIRRRAIRRPERFEVTALSAAAELTDGGGYNLRGTANMASENGSSDWLEAVETRSLKPGNRPQLRMQHARKPLLDDSGNLSCSGRSQARADAVAQLNAGGPLRTRTAGIGTGGSPTPQAYVLKGTSAGLSQHSTGWISLGPHNVGGRTRAIVIDPDNINTMWAGSVAGGVWRSDNGGELWVPTEEFMGTTAGNIGNLAVVSLVRDPATGTLYAGTGEGFSNIDYIPGDGIFMSTDGWSWESLEQTRVTDTRTAFEYVNDLSVTATGSVFLAATRSGLHRSEDTGKSWQNVRSGNFGAVWFNPAYVPRVNPADETAPGANDTHAIASTLDGRLYHSLNGGRTWQTATFNGATPAANNRAQICYAKQDASTVYACIAPAGTQYLGGMRAELWASSDGGRTFTKKRVQDSSGNAVDLGGGQGWYDLFIWADDGSDDQLVVVAGVHLYRSANGGDTFTQIDNAYMGPLPSGVTELHPDNHVIVSMPGNDLSVLVGNDGGVYQTTDIKTVTPGKTPENGGWTDRNAGFSVTQFYYGDGFVQGDTRIVVAGAQDNGTLSHTGGNFLWDSGLVFGGDGGAVAAATANTWYVEYVYLKMARATRTEVTNPNGTKTSTWTSLPIWGYFEFPKSRYHFPASKVEWWQATWGLPLSPPHLIPDAFDETAPFIAPFLLDPKNNAIMYAGGRRLWRSTNVNTPINVAGNLIDTGGATPGISGFNVHSYPTWQDAGYPGGSISAIAIGNTSTNSNANQSNLVLVGNEAGQIWRTTDGTLGDSQIGAAAWTRADNGINASRFCLCVAISPSDASTYYASFGGFTSGNIWKTTNSGTSWTNLNPVVRDHNNQPVHDADGNEVTLLPKVPIRSITFHPDNTDWVYLATEVGVYASEDGGITWSAANEGPASVRCDDFFWMGHILVVVTHGRGLFQIDLTPRTNAKSIVAGDLSGHIYTIDAATGEAAQSKFLAVASSPVGEILVIHHTKGLRDIAGKALADALKDKAYFGDQDGNVYCIDVAKLMMGDTLDNVLTWKISVTGSIQAAPLLWVHPSEKATYLLVSTNAGGLHFLDPYDGDHKSSLQVFTSDTGGHSTVWANLEYDNWCYLTSDRGVYAVNLLGSHEEDGEVKQGALGWAETGIQSRFPPLVLVNTVYISGNDHKVHALETRSGDAVWEADKGDAGSMIGTQPVRVLGSIVVGTGNSSVVGFDHQDGAELYSILHSGGPVHSLTADDNVLYFVQSVPDGKIYKYGIMPSQSHWSATLLKETALFIESDVQPLVIGDKLYVTNTPTSAILCYNTSDLSLAWTVPYGLQMTSKTALGAVYEPAVAPAQPGTAHSVQSPDESRAPAPKPEDSSQARTPLGTSAGETFLKQLQNLQAEAGGEAVEYSAEIDFAKWRLRLHIEKKSDG